ncbi:hypothetical protein MYAM1_003157 [Malassezia yamatoensis]|uniref:Catalase n=1 Tax=Malassezia yamatoensis TaxID=253288 RepID=A0AAJ6CHL5_9BASI|nr:hypothetical protein MYAM1_003157 [Malassezia yamatoensis]
MSDKITNEYGRGGEMHQVKGPAQLTTNQGIPVSDNQNSLKSGSRGPTLLEDFVLREKIFHFDHERIPERIVHARGSAAHGYFEATEDISDLSKAAVFKKGKKTPVFARFSTVAGGAGSVDTPRDVRGFSVKFYTEEGNWDFVGNDIPVFFIQDAIKFPDLIHSVKMEQDRGFPQAASAHDTFWDWASLTPDSTHMQLWAMSDRGIPRSYRMMQGFGIHTFQLVNEKGESHFVKFHWKPKLGVQSTVWDEMVKISGADNDYHRKDLWMAIAAGQFPEWELGIQVFDQKFAEAQPYDVLDSTKIIPEEDIPVKVIGRMVLDRNPDNYFAETEQVAFCPANVPPGIDFSNDPLLQGRLFSYLDTQKSRLGSTNFTQLPINRPKCPVMNFNRDGMMQMEVPKGRGNYEPNSLDDAKDALPRECPMKGFRTTTNPTGPREEGPKLRTRDELFADHHSQARQHYRSLPKWEQTHVVNGYTFELSQVSMPHVPRRIVANLRNVDEELASRVAAGLGIELPEKLPLDKEVLDLPLAPSVSISANARETIEGRNIGILIADGSDKQQLESLVKAIKDQGGQKTLVGPRAHNIKLSDGSTIDADAILPGAPSVVFDAVAVVLTEEGVETLLGEVASIEWVQMAFSHLKGIGFSRSSEKLLKVGNVDLNDDGVTELSENKFIQVAGKRYHDREPRVRALA